MKHFFTFLAAVLITATSVAQVGINIETADPSAALDITSTTGGLLVPRMTETQRDAINPAATGLMIYQTDGTAGFYYYNGNSWEGYYSKNEVDVLIANLQPTTYNIGDIVNGGVVFWVDSTGQHGLVTAFLDVATSVQWGCSATDLPNVPNVQTYPPVGFGAGIGAGFDNTNDILTDCPDVPAAFAARSLGAQWFLPSAKELNQMYVNRETLEGVSGFTVFSNYYWSSTESDINYAWKQYFGNGFQYHFNKDDTSSVRAVRAF